MLINQYNFPHNFTLSLSPTRDKEWILHVEDGNHQRTTVIDKQAAKQCTQGKLWMYWVNTHTSPQRCKYPHKIGLFVYSI